MVWLCLCVYVFYHIISHNFLTSFRRLNLGMIWNLCEVHPSPRMLCTWTERELDPRIYIHLYVRSQNYYPSGSVLYRLQRADIMVKGYPTDRALPKYVSYEILWGYCWSMYNILFQASYFGEFSKIPSFLFS